MYLAIGLVPGVAALQSMYQVATDAIVSGVVMLFAVAPTAPGAEGGVADDPLPDEPLPDEPVPVEPLPVEPVPEEPLPVEPLPELVLPPEEPVAVFEPLPTAEPLLDEVLAAAPAAASVPPLPPQADNANTTAIAATVCNCQTLLALTTLLPRA